MTESCTGQLGSRKRVPPTRGGYPPRSYPSLDNSSFSILFTLASPRKRLLYLFSRNLGEYYILVAVTITTDRSSNTILSRERRYDPQRPDRFHNNSFKYSRTRSFSKTSRSFFSFLFFSLSPQFHSHIFPLLPFLSFSLSRNYDSTRVHARKHTHIRRLGHWVIVVRCYRVRERRRDGAAPPHCTTFPTHGDNEQPGGAANASSVSVFVHATGRDIDIPVHANKGSLSREQREIARFDRCSDETTHRFIHTHVSGFRGRHDSPRRRQRDDQPSTLCAARAPTRIRSVPLAQRASRFMRAHSIVRDSTDRPSSPVSPSHAFYSNQLFLSSFFWKMTRLRSFRRGANKRRMDDNRRRILLASSPVD